MTCGDKGCKLPVYVHIKVNGSRLAVDLCAADFITELVGIGQQLAAMARRLTT
jgi:hypothetical protein